MKTNTCRLAFYPSARNKQLDILDSHYVFKVRSQSCLESSSTVHQNSIFMTSFFFSFLSLQLLCCCRWAYLSRLRTVNAPEIVSMEMTLSGGISQRGLVSKQKAWKISSHKQEEYGIPFHAFLLLNFFGNLLLAIAFSYLKEIIFLLLLFCKGCMGFINKHTLRHESNTACTVNSFSPAEEQSCCGGNITASYQRVLYPRRGRRRAPWIV